MWNCAVEQVLEAVRNGSIPSRVEGGFLLVQVALDGCPEVEPVKARRLAQLENEPSPAPPPARDQDEIVTPQEMAALEGRGSGEGWDSSDEEESVGAMAEGDSSDQPRYDMSQWRSIRSQTSQLRRPPRI
jgi:hypothetical protein